MIIEIEGCRDGVLSRSVLYLYLMAPKFKGKYYKSNYLLSPGYEFSLTTSGKQAGLQLRDKINK